MTIIRGCYSIFSWSFQGYIGVSSFCGIAVGWIADADSRGAVHSYLKELVCIYLI